MFSTYSADLFTGIVNFDIEIGRIDPRYLDVMRLRNPFAGYMHMSAPSRQPISQLGAVLLALVVRLLFVFD